MFQCKCYAMLKNATFKIFDSVSLRKINHDVSEEFYNTLRMSNGNSKKYFNEHLIFF